MQIVANAFQKTSAKIYIKTVFAQEIEDLCVFYDPEVAHKNHSWNTKLLLWMSLEDATFPIICGIGYFQTDSSTDI